MEILNPDWPPLAPLFHYYVTRFEQGGADQKGYLYLDSALAVLASVGICRHADHAVDYKIEEASKRPLPPAYTDALSRRLLRRGLIFRYVPIQAFSRATAIRDQLRAKRPVVIGIKLPFGYPDRDLLEWSDPANPAPSSTRHCLVVYGYSDCRQALRLQDSQGQRFDQGGWWMGYRVADSSVVDEAWALIP